MLMLVNERGAYSMAARWSGAADFESGLAELHVDETCTGVEGILRQNLANAGSSIGVFGNHVEVSATAGTGELVAETEVVDKVGEASYFRRIGAAVEGLVLLPGAAHELSVELEVLSL